MFIQTENTPNPATIKFLPGKSVMESGVHEFTSMAQAAQSPLAERLFQISGVERVMFGADFISVTKDSMTDWPAIKGIVLTAIMQHFTTQQPLFKDGAAQEGGQGNDDLLDDISKQIKELIEQRVRPAVAMDGGDIIFDKFEQGIVYLRMRGACSGCPSSTVTLKNGVESMLRHYVPEVLEVRQVMEY
jgi:Fe-S cluster biogenesis protein NfuA